MNQMPEMSRNQPPRLTDKELHTYAIQLRTALKNDQLEAAKIEHDPVDRAAFAYDASGLLIGMRTYNDEQEAMTFPSEEPGEFERRVTEKYHYTIRGRLMSAWSDRAVRWLDEKADQGTRYTRQEITAALGAFFWEVKAPSLDADFKEPIYMQFERTKDGNEIQLVDKNTGNIVYRGDKFSRPEVKTAPDTQIN